MSLRRFEMAVGGGEAGKGRMQGPARGLQEEGGAAAAAVAEGYGAAMLSDGSQKGVAVLDAVGSLAAAGAGSNGRKTPGEG